MTLDHALATKGFGLYQAVNRDLRVLQLDPFFDELLLTVDSFDAAAAASPAAAATLNAGMNLRSRRPPMPRPGLLRPSSP